MKSFRASHLPRPVLELLQRIASGKVIYVPVGKRRPPNARRDAAIRLARAAGTSVPALAKQHNLSESRVWAICVNLHPNLRGPRP